MPLPTPDYITQVNTRHDHETNECAVLATTASSQTLLFWFLIDDALKLAVHDSIMEYAIKNVQTEANALTGGYPSAGWNVIDFDGTVVGGNPSGLAAQVYTASVWIDGVEYDIVVDGTTATSFTLVLADINVILGANGTAAITAGNITITSSTTGTLSNVTVVDFDLFSTLPGFVAIGGIFVGVDDANDILKSVSYKGFPLRTQFMGNLYEVPNKPHVLTTQLLPADAMYVDASDGVWKLFKNDAPA